MLWPSLMKSSARRGREPVASASARGQLTTTRTCGATKNSYGRIAAERRGEGHGKRIMSTQTGPIHSRTARFSAGTAIRRPSESSASRRESGGHVRIGVTLRASVAVRSSLAGVLARSLLATARPPLRCGQWWAKSERRGLYLWLPRAVRCCLEW
jgi:hypothetical protein